ncbi:MAG: RdgB/HAM1 family non-canonical purine NTP pyrophosphatase [Phycisphaerae bacterium]|nr:RdgB/HAM1 family non-canonical purine NTP pyrophosphatase [Phycisphaerae bacterium]
MSDAAPRRILIATGNPGKLREIVAVLTEPGAGDVLSRVEWLGLTDLPRHVPEPPETETTFAGNAAAKAMYYARETGLWTLADDSGLEVDALDGAPGVTSARYAGVAGERTVVDAANNRKLVAALAGVPAERRTARFRCALALCNGRRIVATAEGVVHGRIIDQPRGRGGFGYDPHFLIDELGRTTAELSAEEKNRVSHRGRAVREIRERLVEGLRSA